MKDTTLIRPNHWFPILAIIICFLATFPLSAQKGRFATGVEGGYVSTNHSGYANIVFQLSLKKHLRIVPTIGYALSNKNKSAFLFNLDLESPFKLHKGIAAYPLVGMAVNNWNFRGVGNTLHLGCNIGSGIDFFLTQDIKLYAIGKYCFIKDFSGVYTGVGMAYMF